MGIFPAIEAGAADFPDSVARLRYLRQNLNRRPKRRLPIAAGVAVAGVVLVCVLLTYRPQPAKAKVPELKRFVVAVPKQPQAVSSVWAVEQHESYSVYSNGLQIRNDYVTQGVPRRFRAYVRGTFVPREGLTKPAGIVFHTTESLLLPLEAGQNRLLLHTREDVLKHVRGERSYNFVIDRFGQVFRIVPEDQVAHHAGHSVWADDALIYEGLNESFLGVSFEARTGGAFEATPAQVSSGRKLTEFLRSTYSISESNCVTHAQVSVNPDNMRIGYHTDWAASFPFHEFGLSGGYDRPVAAIELFGFEYDQTFLSAIGGRPWDGVVAAENRILQEAQQRGLTPANYRKQLQQQYRRIRKDTHELATESNRT